MTALAELTELRTCGIRINLFKQVPIELSPLHVSLLFFVRTGTKPKFISYHGAPALVGTEANHLRQIVLPNGRDFWIPCRAADRKMFRNEELLNRQRKKQKLHISFPIPSYTGEPRPTDYETVKTSSLFPSARFVKELYHLGFPLKAMNGFNPLTNHYERTLEAELVAQEIPVEVFNVNGEVIKSVRLIDQPFAERQAQGHTISEEHFKIIYDKEYLPFKWQEGLRQVLVWGRKTERVAADTNVPLEALRKRAQRFRMAEEKYFPDCHKFDWLPDGVERDELFQRYQSEKGVMARGGKFKYETTNGVIRATNSKMVTFSGVRLKRAWGDAAPK